MPEKDTPTKTRAETSPIIREVHPSLQIDWFVNVVENTQAYHCIVLRAR